MYIHDVFSKELNSEIQYVFHIRGMQMIAAVTEVKSCFSFITLYIVALIFPATTLQYIEGCICITHTIHYIDEFYIIEFTYAQKKVCLLQAFLCHH